MPPKKHIVKSGNAGNSSKSKDKPPQDSASTLDSKPLFPSGSKYPASLLMERCQKNGWEKPIIDTPRKGDGYSFSITLKRINKKSETGTDTVRLEPHPPYIRPSAIEARHWGATYALYRVRPRSASNVPASLKHAGPRDYWNELALEHKQAPQHQSWMYESDPFVARKAVDERQVKAAKRQADAQEPTGSTRASAFSNEFAKCPEVRMAADLRAMVEDSIKKGIDMYPEADTTPKTLLGRDKEGTTSQLKTLGFNDQQVKRAIEFLSVPSTLASSLLAAHPPLQASVEYLILNLPECDLPTRFLPSDNSSNPFITSGHSGSQDLKQRWIKDKAIKEAGWPVRAVQDIGSDPQTLQSFEVLTAVLCQRLIGSDMTTNPDTQHPQLYMVAEEEFTALGAHIEDSSHLIMPLFSAPIHLHILLSPGRFPAVGFTPMYITSASVPAYIRLHLLSRLLQELKEVDPAEEGLCMISMRILEDEWAALDEIGPPDISEVTKHLIAPSEPVPQDLAAQPEAAIAPVLLRQPRRHRPAKGDPRTDAQVKQEFENVCKRAKYTEILEVRKNLPAFKAKDAFLDYLDKNRVVVVVGETGSGKTTQLPQFILDSLILSGSGSQASILITQPRRISAISVSERVHHERTQDASVGYVIRGESRYDPAKTKLLFCTTGVVLRRLSSGDKLEDVTHIVVDEVHERSIDCDFLLLELRELLTHHPTLKIVLMSATVNYQIFTKYFNGAPLLNIPGFTYPVTDLYLEDIIPKIGYQPIAKRPNKATKGVDSELQELQARGRLSEDDLRAISAVSHNTGTDFRLISTLLGYIISSEEPAAVLIFLSGVQEIRQCIEAIRSSVPSGVSDVFPLHSNLSSDEQLRVFAPTKKWKIVVATNVAETSITIDDVVYVIDSGKVKENAYNPDLGFTTLKETWISKAAGRQRRGRAGRTKPGKCFKLFTRRRESQMEDFPIPEILRVPLENILLSVKAMRQQENIEYYLDRALDPPNVSAVRKALSVLTDLGALDSTGSLTPLGTHLSVLPVDLRLGKMLVLSTVFRCIDPMLSVVAILSSKPLFASPLDQREEANRARMKFASSSSDLLTDAKAYAEVIGLRATGRSQGEVIHYCTQNFISIAAIREITTLRNEFMSALADIGFVPFKASPSDPSLNVNKENVNLLKAIVTSGLWPRVARVHLPVGAVKFDKVQAGTVQRENTAKEFRFYDLRAERTFLHPSSVLFGTSVWGSDFVAYFQQHITTKSFIRNVTEIPVYGLLLFGGLLSINHVAGGLTIHSTEGSIKLKAWPRIGVLVNQLRQLLDVRLRIRFEEGGLLDIDKANPVIGAMLALLDNDGRA